jgi:drug/metabolite transporter (DMT)-like permease
MTVLSTGIVMLVGAGLGWAVTGTLLSYLARRRIPAASALAMQMLVAMTLAWVILPDYTALAASGIAAHWRLALLMFVGGFINGAGVLTMQYAMRGGHTGLVWAIGQSALIFPFIVGLIFFHEPATSMRVLGVAAILTALLIYASTRNTGSVSVPGVKANDGSWFFQALSVMVIFGLVQSLMSLPSHLSMLADTARLRVPCFFLGFGMFYFVIWARRPLRPKSRTLGFAAICGVTAVTSTLLLFLALDRLAQAQMASVGFPTGIGASILFYTIYSIIILREPFSFRHAFGMTANLGGLIALALSK